MSPDELIGGPGMVPRLYAAADEIAQTVVNVGSAEKDSVGEIVTDPAVSRAKFEREIRAYRTMEKEYQRRGWFLVRAEYPEVFLLMSAPQLHPSSIQYAMLLDFTNYDLIAPAVRFVNPFTAETLPVSKVLPLHQKVAAASVNREAMQVAPVVPSPNGIGAGSPEAPSMPNGAPAANFQIGYLVQGHGDHPAFLCVPGTREYHAHPYHSNDPWLARRASPVGKLYYLLDIVWRHGILPLTGYSVQINVQIGAPQSDLSRLP